MLFRRLCALCAILAAATWVAPETHAQVPHSLIADSKQITSLTGGLYLTLENEAKFGQSTARIGDLDGDGVADLAVGARDVSPGGAVAIL